MTLFDIFEKKRPPDENETETSLLYLTGGLMVSLGVFSAFVRWFELPIKRWLLAFDCCGETAGWWIRGIFVCIGGSLIMIDKRSRLQSETDCESHGSADNDSSGEK